MNVLSILIGNLPALIHLAEGVFTFKAKSGADKKAFVTEAAKSIVTSVAASSTGGQAASWEKLAPVVSQAIDVSVELANQAGAFGDTSMVGLGG